MGRFFKYTVAAMLMLLSVFSRPGQAQDTAACRHQTPAGLKWVVGGSLLGLGIAGSFDNSIINRKEVREERQEHFPAFSHRIDNYLQFAPVAAVYALDLAGVKARHDGINQTVILLKAEVLMMAVVHPLKNWTHVLRPDSSAYNSFPSGHTAQAFLAASFLSHEFGGKSIWYSVAGYTVATSIGVFRILNNRHWVSDVLAGAGIGILCTEVAYATHKFRWGGKKAIAALPYLGSKGGGMVMSISL